MHIRCSVRSKAVKFRVHVAIVTPSSLSQGAFAQWPRHRGHICKLDCAPLNMQMGLVLIKSRLQSTRKHLEISIWCYMFQWPLQRDYFSWGATCCYGWLSPSGLRGVFFVTLSRIEGLSFTNSSEFPGLIIYCLLQDCLWLDWCWPGIWLGSK